MTDSLHNSKLSKFSAAAGRTNWGELRRHLRDSFILKGCEVCGEPKARWNTRPKLLSDLVKSANGGCRSCLIICLALDYFNMLWKSSEYAQIQLKPSGSKSPSVVVINSTSNRMELDLYIWPNSLPNVALHREINDLRLPVLHGPQEKSDLNPPLRDLALSLDINHDPASKSSYEKICTWLSSCVKNHPTCNLVQSRLPTRVIDVGRTGTGTTCRLYKSRGEAEDYVTLSYCWGDPSLIPKTFLSSLKQNTECIPWNSLSKTFQDAIHMTRKLGIRYLWIDSLCIIQDSLDDWERESGSMADIYQKSYVTLAASASANGSGGLFVERDGDFFEVDLASDKESQVSSIRARRARPHQALDPMADCDPLSTRAWAYQERLLARRIIHFSSEELVWECRTEEMCECGGRHGQNNSSESGYDKARYEDLVLSNGIKTSSSSHTHLRDTWHQLVQAYTRLCLTFEDDRLTALSGIASRLFLESQYLAGLRRDHLIKDLFWISSFDKTQNKAFLTRRPNKYRAPSWSWASVEAPVQWSMWTPGGPWAIDMSVIYDFNIVEASCTPNGSPFGRVSSGYLIVHGRVVEATLLPLTVSTSSVDSSETDISEMFEPQVTYAGSIRHPTRNSLGWGNFRPDYTAFQPSYLSPQRILLLIAGVKNYVYRDKTRFKAAMFVLREFLGEEKLYKRIGWAEYERFDEHGAFNGYTGDFKKSMIKII